MESLSVNPTNLISRALIGVGGIGTGKFFVLEGDHTLRREESRAGHFINQRDYCKLHIITHYVQTLLGTGFQTFPIGRVGDDAEGHQLIKEMSDVSMDTRYVEVIPNGQTLFSFCFVYPDGSGGNLTTNDSVNATVDDTLVNQAIPHFREYRGRGIALAAPEAPLAARLHLLELATEYRFFRASSLTSLEITSTEGTSIIGYSDLLAINADEAAALAGTEPDEMATEQDIRRAIDVARKHQPDLMISITVGKQGSWLWDGEALQHVPAISVNAVNTAGAGDAHFAGLLVGLTAGLSAFQAQQLATLIAALSVLSPHTIHPDINRPALQVLAAQHGERLDGSVMAVLVGTATGSA